MKTSICVTALFAVLAGSSRAEAQHVRLELQNGVVTLDAQNVTVRQILAEWAKVGGAKIVNGEKVVGGPVTLQLKGVPERQALDTILRSVSGYMLAPRSVASAGVSGFDRILIMPTSSAPRAAMPAGAAPPPFQPRPQPVPMPEPVETDVVQDDDHDGEGEEGEVDPGGPESDEESDADQPQPQPGMNPPFQRPPAFPNPMGGGQVQRFTPQSPFPGVAPQPIQNDEAEPPAQPTTGPLNVPPGASSTPGVISPVPQQDGEQPNQRRRRPPF